METRKQFDRNLACLRKYHPALVPLISAFSPIVNNPALPEAVECDVESALQRGCDFYYVLGMGDGAFFDRYGERITRENRGILCIEPDAEYFAAALTQRDFCTWFRSEKAFWVIGDDWELQIEAVFESTFCYAAAQPNICIYDSDVSQKRREIWPNLVQRLRGEISSRKKSLTERIKNLPSILRVHPDGPLRIWAFDDFRGKARYTTIQSVLMRNLVFHLRKFGYEIRYTVLRDGCYYPPYYRIFQMAEFEPDLIFLCNQGPAYEMALGAELSRTLNIPKVVWFADDPVYAEHLLLRHKATPDETYLVADYEWGDPLVENGSSPPMFMPGAATRIRRGRKRSSRRCEVVFVGQVRDQRAYFASLPPAWRDYCQRVIHEKMRYPRKKVREVMAQFSLPETIGADRMDELRQKVLWEANTRFRVNVISALPDCDVRIYGNEAWLALLPPSIAKRSYRGVLRFRHLFEVYRNACVTLNIHSLQSYTCLNVRDFDVPAAGGFLLSDWLPRAEEVYRPGFIGDLPMGEESTQEVFFYRTIPEMQKIIEYFLLHEDHRMACIERARKRVLTEHTYAHRAQFLHELFQKLRIPLSPSQE